MLKLWFIDDELWSAFEDALAVELGAQGQFAEWHVIRSATAAVQQLEQHGVPDVAVIDMRFKDGPEDASLVGSDEWSRGLVVAAALMHYADRNPRYVIYTAYEKAKEINKAVLELPPGLAAKSVNPLIRFFTKADAGQSDVEAVLGWVRAQTVHLARSTLASAGYAEAVAEAVSKCLELLEAELTAARNAMVDDFNCLATPTISSSIDSWKGAPEHVKRAEVFPADMLAAATNVRAVQAALRLVFGPTATSLAARIESVLDDLLAAHGRRMSATSALADRACRELVASDGFKALAYLFPFEARLLSEPVNADLSVDALRTIEQALEVTDWCKVLFRTLKSFPTMDGRSRYKTAFSFATHNAYEHFQHADAEATIPCQSVGTAQSEIAEETLATDLSTLPRAMKERIIADGNAYLKLAPAEVLRLPTTPLLAFAVGYGDPTPRMSRGSSGYRRLRDYWEARWTDWLRDAGVDATCGSDSEPTCILDWRELFERSDTDANRGAIPSLIAALGNNPTASVDVSGQSLRVQMTWLDVTLPATAVDSVRSESYRGGGLSSDLQRLARWGQLAVHAKNQRQLKGDAQATTYKTTILFRPRHERSHSKCADDEPGLTLNFEMRNYAFDRSLAES
jgi:CheY-like chemotaxis protein